MSIRLLAKELYRLQGEVERLERELAAAPWEDRERLDDLLRRARAEKDRMRQVLDGQKDSRPDPGPGPRRP